MPSLKIDLLPGHFAQRRTIKRMLVISVFLLVGTVVLWGLFFGNVKRQVMAADRDLQDLTEKASEVDKIKSARTKIEGQTKAVQPKIDFIESTRDTAGQYWDRFHKINEWIPEYVQVTRFQLSGAPGTDEVTINQVSLSVVTGDEAQTARFLHQFRQCPHISGDFSVDTGRGGGAGRGAGAMMGMGDMGMAMGDMGGMPPGDMMGGQPGGMDMGGPMMGMPGMQGGGGGARGSTTTPGTEVTTLSISTTLTKSFKVPLLAGAPAAGGAASGMGMGMSGPMMGPEMGMGGEMGMMPGAPGAGGPPMGEPPGGGEDAADEDM